MKREAGDKSTEVGGGRECQKPYIKQKTQRKDAKSNSLSPERVNCQEDVAAATSVRHAGLSQARRLADARPKLSGRRSSSTVLSQVCLGLPVLRRQSLGGRCPHLQGVKSQSLKIKGWRAGVVLWDEAVNPLHSNYGPGRALSCPVGSVA